MSDSELGELRTPNGLADSCVTSVMAFWKGTERLANWSSSYTKRERQEWMHHPPGYIFA